MNRSLTVLAIAVATAVLVGWQLLPGTQTAEVAPPEASANETTGIAKIESTPEPIPQPDPSADPTHLAEVRDSSPKNATAMLLERNGCRISDQRFDPETGDYHDVYTCPSRQPEPHAYESWSNETLASLAYGDHKAAEILGLRHVVSNDPEEEALGLSLLYRSVALSGDPEVFHRAIGLRYAYLSVNGEPQIHNLKQLLLFSLIGSKLGGEGFDPKPIERKLRDSAIQPQEVSHLYDVAGQLLNAMAGLQTEMTGNTSIAEVLSDA
ncbi:MAG: hypothetical protein AB7I04_18915 [Pseudomonadales bacterium]